MQATSEKSSTSLDTGAGGQPPATIERLPRTRDTIVVESGIPVLDTAMFEHMQRIAKMMASSSLVPTHLNSVRKVDGKEVAIEPAEAVANCFLVTNQAIRWRMDPFAVAQHTFVTSGKVGYEGKLVAAVINTRPEIEKRLSYTYEGSGQDRKVTVTATLKGDGQPRTVEGKVKDWATTRSGSPWSNSNQHDQMLAYRGAREWARRWLPEAVLGVWGDDEIEHFEATERTLAGEQQPQPTQQRGAAGLKAALQAGAQSATDAEVLTTGKETAPPPAQPQETKGAAQPVAEAKATPGATASPDPKAASAPKPRPAGSKQPGTLELQEKYLLKFKDCKDTEFLSIVRDEVNMYDWTQPDLAEIDRVYRARMKELEG
jgi:hypothetical protein